MIIYISTILGSIALAVVGSLTFWPVTHWFDFYIPIVLLIAGLFGMLLFWWIFVWICGRFVPKTIHSKQSKWSKFWLEEGHDFLMLAARVHIKINDKDKLPTNERFLLVGNHRSNFDSLVMTSRLKSFNLAFITKNSNYKIPLFNRFLYGACYYPLDRNDKIQSLNIFKKCSDLITSGNASIGIFPEGTRQRELIIGEFHEGVFNIALRAKCPIVVVTENGTEAVVHRFPWKSTKAIVDVLGVIPYSQIEGHTAKEISDMVHQIMVDHLTKIDILQYQRKYVEKK